MPSLSDHKLICTPRVILFLPVISGLLFSAAVLSPFLPFTSAYNVTRWILVAATLCFLAMPLLWSNRSVVFASNRKWIVRVLLFTALFGSFISTFAIPELPSINSYLFWGWELLLILSVLVAGEVIASNLQDERNLWAGIRLASLVALGVMGVYSITIVLGLSFWYAGMSDQLRDFVPYGFYNIRFWSHIATWLFPLAILGVGEMRRRPRKGLYVLCLVISSLWVLAAFASAARGHLLAVTLGGLILAFVFRGKVRPLVWDAASVVLLGILLYLVFVILIPYVFLDGTSPEKSVLRSGTSGRMLLWMVGIDASLRDFPLGQGSLSYSREDVVSPFATPHSVYIRWAAEYGWLALAAFLGGVLIWVYPAVRRVKELSVELDARFTLAILWSCLAAAIHASVSGVFSSPHSLLAGMPVMIIFVALVKQSMVDHSSFMFSKTRWRFKWLPFIFVGLAMLYPTYDWYVASVQSAQPYMDRNGVPLGPRFWLHGRYVE